MQQAVPLRASQSVFSDCRANLPIKACATVLIEFLTYYLAFTYVYSTASWELGFAAQDYLTWSMKFPWIFTCGSQMQGLWLIIPFCLQCDDKFFYYYFIKGRDEESQNYLWVSSSPMFHFKHPNHLQKTPLNQMTTQNKTAWARGEKKILRACSEHGWKCKNHIFLAHSFILQTLIECLLFA